MRSSQNRNGNKYGNITDGRGSLAVCPFCPHCPSYKKVRIVPINAIALFRNRLYRSAEQAYKDMSDITKVPSKRTARHP